MPGVASQHRESIVLQGPWLTPEPNKGLELTASSVRSCLAPASRRA
jgi:hypothetical protein